MSEEKRFQEEQDDFMTRWLERRQEYIGKNEKPIQSTAELSQEATSEQDENHTEVETFSEMKDSQDAGVEISAQEDQTELEPADEVAVDATLEDESVVDEQEGEPFLQSIGDDWTEEERVEGDLESLEPPVLAKNSIFKGISPLVWLKSFPIILFAVATLILSVYFVSPYSKEKQISVKGAQVLTTAEVEEFSKITANDYVFTFWLFRENYAKNIENSSPLIKSAQIQYQFPNHFVITIEEYATVGYVKREEAYYPVLASGAILEQAYTGDALLGQFTTIHLQDQDLIKELALQLAGLDSSLRTNIQAIDLTPSKVTPDLLTLTMYDGNKVVVPLTEISEKLVYYPKIVSQLTIASTVDMEVGIFSYPTNRVEETATEEVASDEIITENSE
ncbi:FtsQ-type POTRA domain-containing protein [Streptococcus suis]|nr:FtsQ-type POTRA domain-containing protein [Streptococcus suis]